jgi:hypothetical protein
MGKKYIKGGNIYKEVGEKNLHFRHLLFQSIVKHLLLLYLSQCQVVTITKIIVIN